ncbi:SusC/RagA family TonB-linked outer membrane protein [Paracnuella aquatica]|uniref:SusC/RagA family TonB-linked outer membrane protein n=1 Tax=Paracnuella aquatica TaxID=2268757 RepID=UPI000DEF0D30|nr:SusC/RagA family TonB-linked outer membrane protein [Paracnuella aquatica]RPD50550.1 SusC/RagA family TonB-linked outer membrane protein [Paracnuella aquatica]
MRKIASLLPVLMLLCTLAFGQARTVTGTVRDENGNPIPFASVTESGTNRGTTTDANGVFRISIAQNGTLNVTAAGFVAQQSFNPTGETANISLRRSDAQLQEVVVTGAYNTKRTARSTSYNAQVVTGEQMNTIRQTNLNNALAGKVSGLQVRSQSAAALGREGIVRLRGASGLGGDENIIYVVDGTILPNINDINLDDVADLTVLQGPAAAAQFGPQGANGAIVVTMKKGTRSRGIGIDLNIGAQWDKVYVLPNYQNSYAGGSTADLRKYTWQAGQPEEWKALDGKYYHDYSDDASWGPRMVGQEYIPWYAWYGGHARAYQTAPLSPQKDNARDFFNTGLTLNNTISFSKATDNMNLRFSYGNVDVRGLLPTTSLKRNTFNLNGSIDLNEHFTVSGNINYINQIVNGEISDDYSNQSTGSFNQWFHRNIDMDYMKELRGLRTPQGIYASWNHANPDTYNPANPRSFFGGNYWYNFFTWFDLAKSVTNRDRLFGDASLTYRLNDNFSVRGTFRKQQTNTWFEEKFRSELFESGLQTTGNEPRARGYYATSQSYSNRQNVEVMATYSQKFGDFAVNLNAGTDFFRWQYKDNGGNTDQGLNVPNVFTLSNSKNPARTFNDRREEKYKAILTRGDVGYRNFLFAEFTLRNDWFSTLPTADNDVLSKSFGASFVFSDLVKLPWLSFGKLRASWGEIPQALGTNSTTFGAYRYPGFIYGVNQFQWNGNFMLGTPNELVDSAIRGAVKTQREIGVELRFLKNRLGLTATYWDGTEKDIPRSVPINGASGFTSKLINTGEISKKGIDIQLSVRPVSTQNFSWDINGTLGYLIENKVVKIAEGIDRTTSIEAAWGTTAPYLVHAVGEDWGQLFGNGIKRINGQPVLNSSGFYVNDPNVNFGSVLPKYTGGLQNSITLFKDILVGANIDYQFGGKFFSLSNMWGSYSGLTARTAAMNPKGNPIRDAVADGGGVQVKGVDADGKPVEYYVEAQDYFHNLYNNKTFDEFVYDLTFVKLRELSIGYNLPLAKMGNVSKWANRATISFVARNPILIYAKTPDFDPAEISGLSGETGQLPGTRGFGFNLRVGF